MGFSAIRPRESTVSTSKERRLPPLASLLRLRAATRHQGVTCVKGSLQRSRSRKRLLLFGIAVMLTLLGGGAATDRASGQAEPGPALVAPNLELRTVVDGLALPTSIAFLGADDLLVLEKNSGKVKRIVNGTVQSTALDLA